MKRTRTCSSSQLMVASYLPDECWESIFQFIIDDDDYNTCHSLNSLSLVSKQFLFITNSFRFSLYVCDDSILPLLKRFTSLKSLNIGRYYNDLDNLLLKISCFPLKLTSLSFSRQPTFPAKGMQAFSQNITTLTSLTCSIIDSLNNCDLFLIAECFPLLQELDLSNPLNCQSSYPACLDDGVKALSLALIKLRKVNLSGFYMSNQSFFNFLNNCKLLEDVVMFKYSYDITNAGLASALRDRPTLRSLSISCGNPLHQEYRKLFATAHLIDSLVSLKGLNCLVLVCLKISDDLLYSIATEGLHLTKLVLTRCTRYSYAGIFCLLSKCRRLKHLDLQNANFLNDHHVTQLSSVLGDLLSINLSHCDELTKSSLFALSTNCPSLREIKMERIGSKSVENFDSLGEFGQHPQLKSLYLGSNSWLSDENIIMFSSIFPNLQLLDLNRCDRISEGICQVLRRCCKIRHLDLTMCSNVNLLGMNFVVPKLEVLKLTEAKVDDETLYVISKNCCGLLELSLEDCHDVTEKGVKHVVENCSQLREIKLGSIQQCLSLFFSSSFDNFSSYLSCLNQE